MKTARTMVQSTLAAILFFTSVTSSAQGFMGGGGVSIGVGGPTTMRIKGKVFCSGCSLNEVHKAQPKEPRLYQLTYQQGQVVMKVEWVSNPGRWNHVVWPAKVWLRGADALLLKLAAEENQFKEVEITGILSNTRTFDIADVTVNG